MTVAPIILKEPIKEPAHVIVRELAELTTDPLRRERLLTLADAVEAAIRSNDEAATQDALDRVGLGIEVLGIVRDIRDDRVLSQQRWQALWEHNQRQDAEIAVLKAALAAVQEDCSALRVAQEPESLAQRFQAALTRPMSAAQRVEALRQMMVALDGLLLGAQRDAFVEATAENANAFLRAAEELQDDVSELRAEITALRRREQAD